MPACQPGEGDQHVFSTLGGAGGELACSRNTASAPQARLVDAPSAAASNKKVKEHKAVKDCQVATIEDWKEGSWRLDHEVGDGHIAGENEGDRPSE